MVEPESLPPRRFNRTHFQRALLKWHARLGLVAALFLLSITLTGLLLNHPEWVGIHGSKVTNSWILDHYYGPSQENSAGYRPDSIPLDRVILDLHTGHFFGISGVLLADLAGLALLILVGSGIYNWAKRKRW